MVGIWDYLTTTVYFGMTLANMILAFLIILAGLILRRFMSNFVLHRLAKLTEKSETDIDDLLVDALRKPIEAAIVLVAVGLALGILALPTEPVDLRRFGGALFSVAITVVVTWMIFRVIDTLGGFFTRRAAHTESTLDDALIPLFRKALKVFFAVVAVVVAIQNLGYSVTGIIAGLGIGGLALALAAQDTVANLFGSIMILLDRPFQVGDWVKGSDFEGVIEEIGFRSTRIRTFPKTLVTVPNREMANLIVDNHQAMPARRMSLAVGITYDTTAGQMRDLLEVLEQMLRDQEGILEDGILVRFRNFGDSSLDLLIRGFTGATGYVDHSRIQQEVMLRIMEILEERGLEMAFPSQSVYFGKDETLSLRYEQGGEDQATAPGPRPEAPGSTVS